MHIFWVLLSVLFPTTPSPGVFPAPLQSQPTSSSSSYLSLFILSPAHLSPSQNLAKSDASEGVTFLDEPFGDKPFYIQKEYTCFLSCLVESDLDGVI